MVDLRQKLAEGACIYGTMLVELHTPNIVYMLKKVGFDYLIVDCEHGYFDYYMVANIIAAAKGADLPILVRIPGTGREPILKYVEMGAAGLLVPMVSQAEDVQTVIKHCKYAPLGSRGVSTTRAHTGYHVDDLRTYMDQANADIVVLGQIESLQGLEHISEILDVAGLDGLIVGPNDLSQDMDIINQYGHPRMKAAIQTIVEASRSKQRWTGIITSDTALLLECQELGMQVLSWNSEVGMMIQGGQAGLGRLKKL
ncbi:HpcH/HpaI aldolase family protein [Paenibacillus koleovorans]|uniref:HpcH/HpaI aldolase family protein n=1 Tax=Paenibacillus koleovorans TaxID=121608 RepID=UPI000FD7EDC6|nr:aldolase/citrate lyase family protein [Paenibacillus koleovorans]